MPESVHIPLPSAGSNTICKLRPFGLAKTPISPLPSVVCHSSTGALRSPNVIVVRSNFTVNVSGTSGFPSYQSASWVIAGPCHESSGDPGVGTGGVGDGEGVGVGVG